MNRVLVAGIGNVSFGDDAFGVEVARRLASLPLPEGVVVREFGLRGIDLVHAILDGWEQVVLVDAARRGCAPGTVAVIEPSMDAAAGNGARLDGHSLDPVRVLRAVVALGGTPPPVRIVVCEPEGSPASDEIVRGLSAPAEAAVDVAMRVVESLVHA